MAFVTTLTVSTYVKPCPCLILCDCSSSDRYTYWFRVLLLLLLLLLIDRPLLYPFICDNQSPAR